MLRFKSIISVKSIVSVLAVCGLVAGSVSSASALEVRAANKLTRKVTYAAVSAANIIRVRAGRIVEGSITFAPSLGGSPTGSATEACARVKVSASKFIPGDGQSFGYEQVVKQVSATPAVAGDLSKGCKYVMAGLPASIQLSIDGHYEPPSAWSPACDGNISLIGTSKVMTLMLPDAGVKVTLNQVIDYKYCGNLN